MVKEPPSSSPDIAQRLAVRFLTVIEDDPDLRLEAGALRAYAEPLADLLRQGAEEQRGLMMVETDKLIRSLLRFGAVFWAQHRLRNDGSFAHFVEGMVLARLADMVGNLKMLLQHLPNAMQRLPLPSRRALEEAQATLGGADAVLARALEDFGSDTFSAEILSPVSEIYAYLGLEIPPPPRTRKRA